MRNIEEGSYIILGEMMLYVIVGLIGAMLMFCGDMTLYYTPEDFDYCFYVWGLLQVEHIIVTVHIWDYLAMMSIKKAEILF